MSMLKKYAIDEILHENEGCTVYRAKRISDDLGVIIKMLKSSTQGHDSAAQLTQEYQILSDLSGCCIPKIVEAVTLPSQYFLVFEDIGAISLYDILKSRTFELRESLEIAVNIAKTLHYLHQKHILHADINPQNIIYNWETKDVMLIDYGYSIVDNNFRFNSDTNVGTSGNLLYMSPEQTGRTKQRIDFRSDLYSLGMTLYHLLSGNYPYEAKNRYELIHKQVAILPESLHLINAAIPPVVSRIIDKLISKSPESRYSSDELLIHDLQECLRLLSDTGEIPDFAIALNDGTHMRIGERLYGRESQLETLSTALNRMLADGPISILISGSSGVGKTRLLEEFFTYVRFSGVSVIRAKFELHKVALPYATFKQLFGQLRNWMLTRSTHEQKVTLSASSTQLLSYLFVELRTILKSSHTYGVKPIENISQKLPFALQEFFSAIATQTSPIILFLDDLQWADPQSLELIKKGFWNVNNPYVHLIGSYRDEEGVSRRIRDVFYEKNSLVEITLEPLHQEDLITMLVDILGENGKKIQILAKLLHAKTLGNPFYFKSMVEEFIGRKLLVFEKGHWTYSHDTIKIHSASSNIATIINDKFENLTGNQQGALFYLALLGSRYAKEFTMEMMHSLGFGNDVMVQLAANGFIELTKKEYAFVHDQIQEHVYRCFDAETSKQCHFKIGHYLQHAYEKGDFGDVGTIVYHLNHAYDDHKFPKKLFSLNLGALQEMVQNGSYIHALKRVRWLDEHLFDEKLWESERSHAYTYTQLKCRILYLNGFHDEAISVVQFLISIAHTINERLECFRMIKNICVTQGKNFEALLEYGKVLFKELGMEVPNDKLQLSGTLVTLNKTLTAHPLFENTKAICNLEVTHNVKYQHIASLLIDYWEAAYYLADLEWMQWSYLNIVVQSFAHGNTTESSFGYVLLGGQLVSQKQYKKGHSFGEAAIKLNRQLKDEIMLPKVHNFMANFINPYVKPLSTNVALYQKSLHQSKINGDIVFGIWANFLMLFSDYLAGHSLEEFTHNVAHNSDFILASGDAKMIAIFKILTQTVTSLQGRAEDHTLEEASAIALWEKNQFYPALAWYAILKAQTCLLMGDFEEGLEYCTKYIRSTDNEVIMFPKMRLHFIRALLLMAKKGHLSHDELEVLRIDLVECHSLISVSAKNFKFGRLLLRAEEMKNVASTWEVARVYDEAIAAAQESKNPFYIALGGLCASRFWNSMFFNDLSRFYLNEAIVGLNTWGAYSVAIHISGLQPPAQYLAASDVLPSSSMRKSSMMAEPANFKTLLDSFYAISQSMDSTELVGILMQTILENATASRAILILKEGDEYYTKATIDFTQGKIEMCGHLLSECPLIPKKVIQYALNTGDNVLLENPMASDAFGDDPYILMYKPASCTAITSSIEGTIRSVLYLENESVATPLSGESVRTIEMLLTQASIVLKNTLLFETLSKSEESLNKAQELSHLGNWDYNASTGEIQWSAEVYRIYEMVPFSKIIDYEWFGAHLHPDDAELVRNGVEKALNGKRSYNIRHRIITAQGNEKIVHQKAQTYWEGDVQKMSGTIQDVTDWEEAKAKISRLTQVVDQNPFSTIITDREGVIQYVNLQAIKMTGYFEQELIGKKMNLFCSGVHPKEFYAEMWDTISHKQKMWRGTIINKMKNGENLDCSSTIFPIMNANYEVTNFVTIQENVTQQNIKDKLFMMQTRQAQMGEMLSMIAHQWRQPLSVISSLMNKQRVDIALELYTLDGFMQSISDVDTQVQYLSRTISDFRDFFKPDKDKTSTSNSVIFIKALGLIGHTLKNENIEVIQTHLHDESYLTYEHEMVQVILNLLKNAQDVFGERKTISPQLIIMSDNLDNQCIITVEDNAGGIDVSVMDTLFLPYVSTKNQQNGTGLGLYMSKTIVEDHCLGTLSVENTQSGAKFTITIPTKDIDGAL